MSVEVNYISKRDAIMDKYWIEFLNSEDGDSSSWKGGVEAHFWWWFYNDKSPSPSPSLGKLESYL